MLYITWGDRRCQAFFVPLHRTSATLTDGLERSKEDWATWQSIVEMSYGLIFETLQPRDLNRWHLAPRNVKDFQFTPLNVQLPLWQNEVFEGKKNSGMAGLASSPDLAVRKILADHMDRIRPMAIAASRAKHHVNLS